MGIPRLASRLSSYSHPVVLNDASQKRVAIIDGPGLVHHVYYKLCDRLRAPVSYSQCARETIAWLDTLKSFGFVIEAVFFDGALPPSKKDVRIERLQAYITRLQAFKQNSATNLSSMSPEVRKSLPPPPFIVFAVVEELLRSHYKDLTHMVPGEADPYCVAAAQVASADSNEGTTVTIFSDDSDLLVYDSGKHSSIITLRDLVEIVEGDEQSWSGVEFCPSQIAVKAPNPASDLIKPAYIMSKDLYLSLENAKRKIGEDFPADSEEFDCFAASFSISAESAEWARIQGNPQLKSGLESRDSRVSELIWQLQTFNNSASQGGLRMYLPFITDDISRSTAWNVATDIRQLAYSILLRSFKCDTSIQEYRRSGTRVASVLIDRLPDPEIEAEVTALSSHIAQLQNWMRDSTQLEDNQVWRYLTIQYVLRYCLSDNQSLPTLDDTVRATTGGKERKWSTLHLNSQYQAAFYSLRLLKQILSYALEQKPATETETNARSRQADLYGLLGGLPRINIFFAEMNDESRKQEDDIWRDLMKDLLALLAKKADVAAAARDEEARPRKKAKKTKKAASEDIARVKNPFAMLAEEP